MTANKQVALKGGRRIETRSPNNESSKYTFLVLCKVNMPPIQASGRMKPTHFAKELERRRPFEKTGHARNAVRDTDSIQQTRTRGWEANKQNPSLWVIPFCVSQAYCATRTSNKPNLPWRAFFIEFQWHTISIPTGVQFGALTFEQTTMIRMREFDARQPLGPKKHFVLDARSCCIRRDNTTSLIEAQEKKTKWAVSVMADVLHTEWRNLPLPDG